MKKIILTLIVLLIPIVSAANIDRGDGLVNQSYKGGMIFTEKNYTLFNVSIPKYSTIISFNGTLNGTYSGKKELFNHTENGTQVYCTGVWSVGFPCINTHDNNWSSYGSHPTGTAGESVVFLNYSKPSNATGATWNISMDKCAGLYNLSDACFNQTVLQLRVTSASNGINTYSGSGHCYNGTAWELQCYGSQGTGHFKIYEERVQWWTGSYPYNVSVKIDDVLAYYNNSIFNGFISIDLNNGSALQNCVNTCSVQDDVNCICGVNISFDTYGTLDYKLNVSYYPYSWSYATGSLSEFSTQQYGLIVPRIPNSTDILTNSSAALSFNGTIYTPTKIVYSDRFLFNVSTIPIAGATTVTMYHHWLFNLSYLNGTKDLVTTVSKSQDFSQIYIGDCGGLTNTTTLNFTFKDEITDVNITTDFDGTLELWKGSKTNYRNQSFNKTGNYTYQFCISPNTTTINIDAVFLYDAVGYPVRTYYLCDKALTSTKSDYDLYHLSTVNATAVTLTLTDDSDDPLVGYYVDLMRWYPETNEYKTVEVTKTDEDGQVRNQVDMYDVFYRWRFRQCNNIFKQTGRNQIAKTSLTYQLIVGVGYLESWASLRDINYNLAYENSTTTFTLSWSDVGGSADYYCLKVVRAGGLGMTTLSDVCSTEKSGALEYVLPEFEGRIIATAYAKESGSSLYMFVLDTYELFTSRPWTTTFGATGLIMTGVFVMTLAFVGLTVAGVTGLVLFMLIGLGAFAMIGMMALKISVFVSLCILGGVLIWRIKP